MSKLTDAINDRNVELVRELIDGGASPMEFTEELALDLNGTSIMVTHLDKVVAMALSPGPGNREAKEIFDVMMEKGEIYPDWLNNSLYKTCCEFMQRPKLDKTPGFEEALPREDIGNMLRSFFRHGAKLDTNVFKKVFEKDNLFLKEKRELAIIISEEAVVEDEEVLKKVLNIANNIEMPERENIIDIGSSASISDEEFFDAVEEEKKEEEFFDAVEEEKKEEEFFDALEEEKKEEEFFDAVEEEREEEFFDARDREEKKKLSVIALMGKFFANVVKSIFQGLKNIAHKLGSIWKKNEEEGPERREESLGQEDLSTRDVRERESIQEDEMDISIDKEQRGVAEVEPPRIDIKADRTTKRGGSGRDMGE